MNMYSTWWLVYSASAICHFHISTRTQSTWGTPAGPSRSVANVCHLWPVEIVLEREGQNLRSHTSSSIFRLTGRRVGILLFLLFILLLALVTFFCWKEAAKTRVLPSVFIVFSIPGAPNIYPYTPLFLLFIRWYKQLLPYRLFHSFRIYSSLSSPYICCPRCVSLSLLDREATSVSFGERS